MNDKNKKIPLDAKLLSYAIIELNIARRNVAIYPQEHLLDGAIINEGL